MYSGSLPKPSINLVSTPSDVEDKVKQLNGLSKDKQYKVEMYKHYQRHSSHAIHISFFGKIYMNKTFVDTSNYENDQDDANSEMKDKLDKLIREAQEAIESEKEPKEVSEMGQSSHK